MKKLLFILVDFCSLQTNAQPYSINFAGTALSSIKVENLTTGVIVDVPAGDVLLLSTTTGIPEVNTMKAPELKIYPNPMIDKSTLVFLPPLAGDVIISVCDMTGKVITQFRCYVENYTQEFSLSDIKNGLYLINIQGKGYQLSEKLISNGKSNGTAIIACASNNIQTIDEKKSIMDSNGVKGSVNMTYTAGERLKYTAISGNNRTVMTVIPTEDNTVTFTFTECKDGDNNYYPVVQINTQLWMAENLKTTKYKDGTTPIPNVIEDVAWTTLSGPAYCWYGNIQTNKDVFGALYNFFAVSTGNLCPTGWHVPSDTEWASLITFLGGADVAGSKLKETGVTHWNSSNINATNETGFTALPGGYRYGGDGTYARINGYGHWWSSSTWYRWIESDHTNVYRGGSPSSFGFSIRCIRD